MWSTNLLLLYRVSRNCRQGGKETSPGAVMARLPTLGVPWLDVDHITIGALIEDFANQIRAGLRPQALKVLLRLAIETRGHFVVLFS